MRASMLAAFMPSIGAKSLNWPISTFCASTESEKKFLIEIAPASFTSPPVQEPISLRSFARTGFVLTRNGRMAASTTIGSRKAKTASA